MNGIGWLARYSILLAAVWAAGWSCQAAEAVDASHRFQPPDGPRLPAANFGAPFPPPSTPGSTQEPRAPAHQEGVDARGGAPARRGSTVTSFLENAFQGPAASVGEGLYPSEARELLSLPPVAEEVERPAVLIDFGTALALTEGQSPRVAAARARIAQAFAQYQAAQLMWLPNIRSGMNYNKHEGSIQDVVGHNIETSRGAAFGGLGASAVGAASPAVPGVSMQFHVSDAIHQKEIQRYAYHARQFEYNAALNDQLLETALAYVSLLRAHQQRVIARESLKNGEELAKLTADFARTGAGIPADADRAMAALSLLRNELVRAEEAIAVSSARLVEQLSADPAAELVPTEPFLAPLELVASDEDLPAMIAVGLSNRPELRASHSLVAEAASRLRREKNAPWLPSIVLGTSYGAFGAGTGGDISHGADRFDFDAAAWWELRNLGWGERAARDEARAQVQASRMREIATMDLVAREIAEARAQSRARRRQIAVAEQGVQAALRSHVRNLDRIRNGQGLPIESLQSILALDAARRDYLRAVEEFNTAQFRLQRALGWPITAP